MATALERAAQITPVASNRTRRRLAAAWAALVAGDLDKSAALLADAGAELPNERTEVQIQKLGAALTMAAGEEGQVSTALLQAAKAFERLDPLLSRDTHLQALEAAMYEHQLGPLGIAGAARAARRAPRVARTRMRAADFLLDGYSELFAGKDEAEAVRSLRRAIDMLRQRGELRWLGLACLAAGELWDEAAMQALAGRRVRLARRDRALTVLPGGLTQLGAYEMIVGRFEAAEALFDEARRVAAWTGNPGLIGRTDPGGLMVAVWRGNADEARAMAEDSKREATARGQGSFVNLADWLLAVLDLSLGNYEAARIGAQEARKDRPLLVATRALPELIEAAARSRRIDEGRAAANELAKRVTASGTRWGLGTLARSQALLSADSEAQELYREAIGQLKRCRATPDLARAHLVYGEWLRRRRRRVDARNHLRTAYQMFASMGAGAFAERARAELLAAGDRTTVRSATRQALTPQEAHIAELASKGGTNAEIAEELFISPRTVEYHLRKIFRKLGLSSRTQLTPQLLDAGGGVSDP
jgi:DNA-binding CsgD family transcriptional regulator